jgi:hypothetical protein
VLYSLPMELLANSWNYVWYALRTHPFNFFTLLFAFGAFVVSVTALVYSSRQASAAETQAKEAMLARKTNEKAISDQAEALKRQAELAERSAEAAHRSATAAEESARLAAQGQRAWVVIDVVQAKEWAVLPSREAELTNRPAGMRVSVLTTIKNSGQTIANELRITQELRIASFGPDDSPRYEPFGIASSVGSLGAGAPAQLRNMVEVSLEAWNEIMEGRQTLCLLGMAEYRDAFGNARETRWFMEYQRSTLQFAYGSRFNSTT